MMDKHTEESTKQSVQKDDPEETSPLSEATAPGPFPEDTDPDDRSAKVTKDETQLNESGPSKECQVEGVGAVSVSTVVHQDEVEFKHIEAVDLSKDEGSSNSQSVIRLEAKTSIENASSKMCLSQSLNPSMESGSSAEVVDVPTHQASETSISTSNTISTSLAQRSEPIAIPSTSRDSSGLAPDESSPKRPTNFGPNVKQAVHVFHPRHPTSVLRRFPVPYHRGSWVYLRDSPESSDYGGSPDSLDDPFLMEALDINTPEYEKEDFDTPNFEEEPLCSPPLLHPVENHSPSESGQVGGAIGDEPSESGHIETSIEDISSESGHIKVTTEDPVSGFIKMTTKDIPSETTIGDIPSKSDNTKMTTDDLTSDSRHIGRTIEDLLFESGHNEETIRYITSKLAASEESVVDEPSELDYIYRVTEDLSHESAAIERSLLNSPFERRRRVDVMIGTDTTARSIGELQYESDRIGLLEGTDDVGTLPHESGYSGRRMDDLVSESGHGEKTMEDLPSPSTHLDEGNGVVASESDHI